MGRKRVLSALSPSFFGSITMMVILIYDPTEHSFLLWQGCILVSIAIEFAGIHFLHYRVSNKDVIILKNKYLSDPILARNEFYQLWVFMGTVGMKYATLTKDRMEYSSERPNLISFELRGIQHLRLVHFLKFLLFGSAAILFIQNTDPISVGSTVILVLCSIGSFAAAFSRDSIGEGEVKHQINGACSDDQVQSYFQAMKCSSKDPNGRRTSDWWLCNSLPLFYMYFLIMAHHSISSRTIFLIGYLILLFATHIMTLQCKVYPVNWSNKVLREIEEANRKPPVKVFLITGDDRNHSLEGEVSARHES